MIGASIRKALFAALAALLTSPLAGHSPSFAQSAAQQRPRVYLGVTNPDWSKTTPGQRQLLKDLMENIYGLLKEGPGVVDTAQWRASWSTAENWSELDKEGKTHFLVGVTSLDTCPSAVGPSAANRATLLSGDANIAATLSTDTNKQALKVTWQFGAIKPVKGSTIPFFARRLPEIATVCIFEDSDGAYLRFWGKRGREGAFVGAASLLTWYVFNYFPELKTPQRYYVQCGASGIPDGLKGPIADDVKKVKASVIEFVFGILQGLRDAGGGRWDYWRPTDGPRANPANDAGNFCNDRPIFATSILTEEKGKPEDVTDYSASVGITLASGRLQVLVIIKDLASERRLDSRFEGDLNKKYRPTLENATPDTDFEKNWEQGEPAAAQKENKKPVCENSPVWVAPQDKAKPKLQGMGDGFAQYMRTLVGNGPNLSCQM